MSGMMRPPRPSNTVVGIDFGTTKICVVVGKETEEGLQIVGIGKQPSLGIRKGVVVNIPTTVEAVKKAAQTAELMADSEIKEAFVGIAGTHIKSFNSCGVVAVKNKEVTEHDVERAMDAARAVAIPPDREVIHVIPHEFTVNNQDGVKDPVGMSGVRLESKVHIVTGSISSAQNVVKCATQAGVKVLDMILEPLASAEAVLCKDEKELGVAVVDIGGGTTDVALFVHGSVVHTGVVPMGGSHVTNDIAVGLRTSIQEAEKIKVSSGCAMNSMLSSEQMIEVPGLGGRVPREVSRSVLTKIIEPRLEEILSLVSKEIIDSGFKQLLSSGVVITGGSSLFEGLPELAEFILELPVRRGFPEDVGGLQDGVKSPIYSTAVGLLKIGLRSHSGEKFKFRVSDNSYLKMIGRIKTWLSEAF